MLLKRRYWHWRVLLRYLASRVALVDQYCYHCGMHFEAWLVDDEDWEGWNHEYDVLCKDCFMKFLSEN